MRQPLEPHLGGRGHGVGVVGIHVAAPDLDRVHADGGGGHVHETLGDRHGDGMAHRAILAGRGLVLEDDRRLRAVVGKVVGAAAEVHHLVALDGRGAGIDRIGPDAGPVVDVDGEDLSLRIHRDLRLDLVVAGVDVGGETLQPVGDELYRAAHDLGDGGGRDLVGVDMHLDPVGPAHVAADHPHPAFGNVEVLGQNRLDHVRRLGGVVGGHLPLGRVPVDEDGTGFERDAGVPRGAEAGRDHLVGRGHRGLHVAFFVQPPEGEVVAEVGVDHRRAGIERGHRVGDHRKRVVVHVDPGGAVLCRGAGRGDDGHHRLAHPCRAVDRQRVLRRGLQALQVRQNGHPWRADLGQIGAGEDPKHALHVLRIGQVDPLDPGMGKGRSDKGHMHHAGQGDVVHVAPAPLHQLGGVGAGDRLADVGIGTVGVSECDGHARPFPTRACATLSTASTMAS